MGKTLYLMRHGETVFNVTCRIQGWVDSPLTETGIEQARAAGRELAARGVTVDHAFCSTAERASDTLELALEAMGQAGLPYERLKALKERYHGRLEAESERLNHHMSIEEMDRLLEIYGGEDRAAVTQRMVPALTAIMERPDCTNVLAVSHAGASLAFLTAFEDMDRVRREGFGNCTIWALDFVAGSDGVGPAFVLRETIHPAV